MSVRALALVAVAALCLAAPAAAVAQDDHSGHHPAVLTLDHGALWTTDAPLREGMATMRAAAAAPDVTGLPALVDAEVDHIIAACQLPPEADAQLHIVIEQLVEAADLMRAGGEAEGRDRIIAALNAYGAHFDHPGWVPIAP